MFPVMKTMITSNDSVPMVVRRAHSRSGAPAFVMPALLVLVAMAIAPPTASAQYFGRNKVHYEDFGFRMLTTPHFHVFYYPEEEAAARDGARMAERWYQRLVQVFDHEFAERKPMIFYANHGDFSQTSVVDEIMGEGTGGFTEPLQDRVVLPFTGSYADNDHVIGHELVHAFQYDIVNRTMGYQGLQRMSQLPLWFIEGMAEYLSTGRNDPNTAMWMRDVVLRDKIPTIEDVGSDSRYFPYRYGQAIWAYIGARWGDPMIVQLYGASLRIGWEPAVKRLLGLTEEELSRQWHDALIANYGPVNAARTKPADVGRRLLKAGEQMSVAPSLSPDGSLVAFLSSRSLTSIDLYLADANTGVIRTKLLNAATNPHMDAIRFINSSGAWSPDGSLFATVIYNDGDDQIALVDVARGSIQRTLRLKDLGEITSPSFSPDGGSLVFSGSRGGISDLYIVELATNKVKRLTNDRNADFAPVWSPDGTTIAFSTDRGPETDFARLTYSEPRIALYTLSTGAITVLPQFALGKNINPQYSPDGRDIYFVADHDGVSNIYRYRIASGEVARITNAATGITGIAGGSPAISVARASGRIAASVFDAGSYAVHIIEPGVPAVAVPERDSLAAIAGVLPPPEYNARALVRDYLADPDTGLLDDSTFTDSAYSAAIRLSYLGAPTLGASVSNYGTSLIGGISAYFSDILNYHQLAATVQMNGSIEDIGGEVQYLYTRNRWNWGARAAHIPEVRYGRAISNVVYEPPGGQPVNATEVDDYTERIFQEEVGFIGQYPFTTTRRFELNVGYTHVGFSSDLVSQLYVGGQVVARFDTSLPSAPGLNLLGTSVAMVGDNSFFGYTSPISGQRYRAEVGGTVGSLKFATLLLDYRKYFFLRPATIALRGYHFGRYGGDAQSDLLTPLFLGYPTNVRGYESGSFANDECVATSGGGCPVFDRLLGSRIALVGAEVRAPLFGTSGYGLINAQGPGIELVGFFDGGLAWSPGSNARLAFATQTTDRVPVFSAGFSARTNLYGYLVLEVYYAYPFQRPDAGWQWGISIAPGW